MWCSQPMKKIIFYSLQIFRCTVIETQNSLLLVLVRKIMYTIIQRENFFFLGGKYNERIESCWSKKRKM